MFKGSLNIGLYYLKGFPWIDIHEGGGGWYLEYIVERFTNHVPVQDPLRCYLFDVCPIQPRRIMIMVLRMIVSSLSLVLPHYGEYDVREWQLRSAAVQYPHTNNVRISYRWFQNGYLYDYFLSTTHFFIFLLLQRSS